MIIESGDLLVQTIVGVMSGLGGGLIGYLGAIHSVDKKHRAELASQLAAAAFRLQRSLGNVTRELGGKRNDAAFEAAKLSLESYLEIAYQTPSNDPERIRYLQLAMLIGRVLDVANTEFWYLVNCEIEMASNELEKIHLPFKDGYPYHQFNNLRECVNSLEAEITARFAARDLRTPPRERTRRIGAELPTAVVVTSPLGDETSGASSCSRSIGI